MAGSIITLHDVRAGKVRCDKAHIAFPQLFRRTGTYWKLRRGAKLRHGVLFDNRDDLVPSKNPATSYELSNTAGPDIANPVSAPMDRMDIEDDSGRVIIRHHESRRDAYVYLDGIGDMQEESNQRVYDSRLGIFTLVHRKTPKKCMDRLIVYISRVPDTLGLADFPVDRHQIVDAFGNLHEGDDLLFPSDQPGVRSAIDALLSES